MRIARLIPAILALVLSGAAWAQGVPQQAGPWASGRAPMYTGYGSGQPIIQDSGPASGGQPGIGLSELGLTARGPGTPPYAGMGTGQFGANLCDYDAPTTNPTGYHYLCLSPNAQGGGLIAYGAAGAASVMPLQISVNGTAYQFPFSVSGIVGPGVSQVGDVALFNNATGTLLKDLPASFLPILASGTTTSRTLAARSADYLWFTDFGADPTGAVPSDAAFTAWLAAMKATGKSGMVGQGFFNFVNPPLFDTSGVIGVGIRVYGQGCNTSTFNYSGSTAPAFRLGSDTLSISTFVGASSGTYTVVTTGGSGYVNGSYTAVPLTGGSGSGATADIVVSGGVVSLIKVRAGGLGYTVGNVLSALAINLGGTGSGLQITVATTRGDNFYSQIKGISFTASVAGPLLQLGRNDMADPINGGELDVCTNNSSTNAAAIGVKYNGWIDSPYSNVVASNAQAGTACYIDGAAFSNFYGSCSGALTGMILTATANQAVFGNQFHAIDMEVNYKDVVIQNNGLAPAKNTWFGGQFDAQQYSYPSGSGPCAIDAQAGTNNLFINGNLGGSTDFCGTVGAQTIGSSGNLYTNQSLQALGVTQSQGLIVIPPTTATAGLTMQAGPGGSAFQIAEDTSGNGSLTNYGTGTSNNHSVTAGGSHNFFVNSVLEAQVSNLGVTTPRLNTTYMLFSAATPAIASGFGTSPSISAQNGSASFRVYVGTGGTATSGVVTLPTAQNGWNCFANDLTTTSSTVFLTKQTANTTTTVTFGNFNTSGAAAAWAAGDQFAAACFAF